MIVQIVCNMGGKRLAAHVDREIALAMVAGGIIRICTLSDCSRPGNHFRTTKTKEEIEAIIKRLKKCQT